MRRRALLMVLKSVVVAVALLGLPLAFVAPTYVWRSYQASLDNDAKRLAEHVDRVYTRWDRTPAQKKQLIANWVQEQAPDAKIKIENNATTIYQSGKMISAPTILATAAGNNGVNVEIIVSGWPALQSAALVLLGVVSAVVVAFGAGMSFALRESRRLAAPLIYLSAQAEQLGSGAVQARMGLSGIEEIDLVSEELSRTGERIAGLIAKERQFGADVTHQLRTPLTALSMRIEEIQYLSSNQEITDECLACLEQIERMTQVMEDLKRRAADRSGSVQAVKIEEIFLSQQQEWEPQFAAVDREIEFRSLVNDRLPLATPGSLSQAIATLIENSLRYGAGKVVVQTRAGESRRSLFVEVSDEGAGVSEEIAPDIFRRGVSGHGSSGIGLALARDLVQADGGRLELTQRTPPVFTISLTALPAYLSPDRVMPKGAMISVGRRGRGR